MKPERLIAALVLMAAAALGPACSSRPALQLDPESEAFYRTARLIMTKEEDKIFRRLPDAGMRKEFIADFWAKRDPYPETPENEFKVEFEARVDYANRRFMEGGPGYNTDRGRIYIFMGPPDKFEEFFNHEEPGVRGPILWWIYYDYDLGIEFADERGNGQYRIRNYMGNFFEALDSLKLGRWVAADDVFKKAFVKFDLTYEPEKEEFELTLPVGDLAFTENEDGSFRIDLDFVFYIYPDQGAGKETFSASRTFSATNAELLEMKTLSFRFSRALPPGTSFVDVIIKGREAKKGQVRRIFEIEVEP